MQVSFCIIQFIFSIPILTETRVEQLQSPTLKFFHKLKRDISWGTLLGKKLIKYLMLAQIRFAAIDNAFELEMTTQFITS